MSNFSNNNSGQRIGTDRFGRPSILKGAKMKDNGFAKPVYVDIAGKTYKIDVSDANKDGVKYWVRVTRMEQRNTPKSF